MKSYRQQKQERKDYFEQLRKEKEFREERYYKDRLERVKLDCRLHNEWVENGGIMPHPKWGYFSDKEIIRELNNDGKSDEYIRKFLDKFHSDKEVMQQLELFKCQKNG